MLSTHVPLHPAERRVVVVNKCPQGNVTGIETMTMRTPVGSQPHDDRVLVQYTQRIAFGSVERVGLGSVRTRLTYEMIIQPQERIYVDAPKEQLNV